MRATSLLRRFAVLALLFAMSGAGRIPERGAERAEVVRMTAAARPRVAEVAPVRRATRSIADVTALTHPPVVACAGRTPRAVRPRFARRIYLRHRALLL